MSITTAATLRRRNPGIVAGFVTTTATLPFILASAATAGTSSLSYTSDFNGSTLPTGSTATGTAALVSSNGVTRLRLAQHLAQSSSGTWDSGSLSLAAGGSITSFNATFDFGFNDTDLSFKSDYLAFRVGSLEVGFSLVSNPGVHAYWEGAEQAYAAHNQDYLDSAFSVNNGGTNWLVGGQAEITWAQGGDLVVKLTVPGFAQSTYLSTSALGSITLDDTTTFGFASWQGVYNSDSWVDNLNVNYDYSTPSTVPGAGIAGLASIGLAGLSRRRRR